MARYLPIALLLVTMSVPALAAGEPAAAKRPCSMDAMTAAEKQQLVTEHARRVHRDGQAVADEWVREQGRAFRRQLVAEGVCPPLPANAAPQVPQNAAPANKKPVLDKKGHPCKTIRMEHQLFPNFGGAPMTMAMIPVCADE